MMGKRPQAEGGLGAVERLIRVQDAFGASRLAFVEVAAEPGARSGLVRRWFQGRVRLFLADPAVAASLADAGGAVVFRDGEVVARLTGAAPDWQVLEAVGQAVLDTECGP